MKARTRRQRLLAVSYYEPDATNPRKLVAVHTALFEHPIDLIAFVQSKTHVGTELTTTACATCGLSLPEHAAAQKALGAKSWSKKKHAWQEQPPLVLPTPHIRVYLARAAVQVSCKLPKIKKVRVKKSKGPKSKESHCNLCGKWVAFKQMTDTGLVEATCGHTFDMKEWMRLAKKVSKTKMEQRRYRIFLYDAFHKTVGTQVWSGKREEDMEKQKAIVCRVAGIKPKEFEKKFIWKLQ